MKRLSKTPRIESESSSEVLHFTEKHPALLRPGCSCHGCAKLIRAGSRRIRHLTEKHPAPREFVASRVRRSICTEEHTCFRTDELRFATRIRGTNIPASTERDLVGWKSFPHCSCSHPTTTSLLSKTLCTLF